MQPRFEDSGQGIHAFMDDTLIVCPKCSSCAVSRRMQQGTRSEDWFAPRRLTCTRCSFTRDWAEREIARGWDRAEDDYFGLPLWLQTRCCGELLWAINEQHLAALEAFVGARLRERRHDEVAGWSNRSLPSRLPAWIKSGKNRDEVLQGLARLRARLVAAA